MMVMEDIHTELMGSGDSIDSLGGEVVWGRKKELQRCWANLIIRAGCTTLSQQTTATLDGSLGRERERVSGGRGRGWIVLLVLCLYGLF